MNKRNIEQQSKDNRVNKISFSTKIEQSAKNHGLVDDDDEMMMMMLMMMLMMMMMLVVNQVAKALEQRALVHLCWFTQVVKVVKSAPAAAGCPKNTHFS